MKKILSVFLATILLLSCLSVGLTSFAAVINYTGEDLNALIDMIDKKTATLTTNEKDENGNITHYVPGYNLKRDVSNNVTLSDNKNKVLNNVVTNFLPEFSGCFDETGSADAKKIVETAAGFSSLNLKTVAPSVEGAGVFGKDALKNIKLDANTIKSATCDAQTKTRTYTINFNDFSYAPDVNDPNATGLEDSALPDLLNTYMAADTFTSIIDRLNKSNSVIMNDYKCDVSNITLKIVFNDAAEDPSVDKIYSVTISYNVNAIVDCYYMYEPVKFELKNALVTTTYNNFVAFDSQKNIDYNALSASINEGTAYVVDNKPGYGFEKISDYPAGLNPTLVFSGTILGALSGFINPEEKFVELVDKTIDRGLYSDTVKPTKVAADTLGSNYAVKATNILPEDFKTVSYNKDINTFICTLNDETNPTRENSKLAKLTNTFVSQQELRDKFGINFTDKAGISLLKADDTCEITYSDINVYIAFEDATEANPYGNGKIKSYCVKYYYIVDATINTVKATIHTEARMLTDATNFEYVTYEVGDVDQSGKVSIADVKSLLQGISGAVTLTDTQKSLADISGDGKMSIVDAKLLLDYIANTTV